MSNARLVALRLLVMSALAKLPMLVRNEPTFTLAVGPKIIPPGENRNTAPLAFNAPLMVVGDSDPIRLKAIELALGWLKVTVSPLAILKLVQSSTTRCAV